MLGRTIHFDVPKYNHKVLLLVVILAAGSIQAQDAQYWNLSYGTNSNLLGGAVIGSVSDLSAVFYNPGMLGLKRDAELVLGAKVLEYSTLQFEAETYKKYDLGSRKFRPSPTFFAGTFIKDSAAVNRISYSFLTRQYFDFTIEGRSIQNFPDIGVLGSELIFTENLSEVWGGVTWSHRYNDFVGFGITQFVAFRSELKRNHLISNSHLDGNGFDNSLITNYDYYSVRTLWKLGIGVDLYDYSYGFTITTPSINLFGSGESYYHYVKQNASEVRYFASNIQKDLSAKYKNTWALGAGGSYRIDKTKIHLSAEWYPGMSAYKVIDMGEFEAQSNGKEVNYDLFHETKSIVNFGAGVEFSFIENISGFASFSADFSNVSPNSKDNLAVSLWNIYHLIGGGTFRFDRSEITAGFEYAFGRESNISIFEDIDKTIPIREYLEPSSRIKYDRYKLILVLQIQF